MIRRSRRCSSTTRIRRRFVRTTTKWCAGFCGQIFSPWCTSSSLPIRPITPTSFCPPRHSSSTKICRKPTGITICKSPIRRSHPLGECRSNVEVFRALAQRMGFEEDCFRETVDEMIDSALESEDPWLNGISRERLERGQVRLNFGAANSQVPASGAELRSAGQPGAAVPTYSDAHPEPFLPFAHGGFRTASGKAELYSEAVKQLGLDPVADFTPPTESRHGRNSGALPLELLARKADNFLNSTFSNVPSVREMEEAGLLEICTADARGARHREWRPGPGFQSPGRHPAEGTSRWQSSAGSRFGDDSIGRR